MIENREGILVKALIGEKNILLYNISNDIYTLYVILVFSKKKQQ